MQEAVTSTRKQRARLRDHTETLLLKACGMKWNMARGLPPGAAYATMNEAFRRHLDQLEQMQSRSQSPMQQAASIMKGLLSDDAPPQGAVASGLFAVA